jgi:prevent-host-death family protein
VSAVVRVGMHEAKSQLSRLVALAEGGEDVVIQRSGRPIARLVAFQARRPVAEAFGALRGEVELAEDFDELPAEFAEHFR